MNAKHTQAGPRPLRALAGLALLLALAPGARAQEGGDAEAARALEVARTDEQRVMELIERTSRAFVAIGGGSGIVVSADGEILTNHHVAGSRPIGSVWIVTRPGGAFAKAKLIGSDPRGDISYLKLLDPGPYPFVPLADSDQVGTGQRVLALGNPFGVSKDGTPHATVGVVSGVHRYQGAYSDAIVTDAPINPGNSGGPLIDMQGRLIGINGRIQVRFGTRNNTGVGYAIPTNQIKRFLPHFRRGGLISHGLIAGLNVTNTERGGDGAYVRSVRSGTAADEAGLRAGDTIVAVDGLTVNGANRLNGLVGIYPAGDTVKLSVKRGDRTETLSVTLAARDPQYAPANGARPGTAWLGIHVSLREGGGVEVEEVILSSPAEAAGLLAGDLLLTIGGARIRELDDVRKALVARKAGDTVTIEVRRGEGKLSFDVTLGTKPAGR